jgi:hypothetical protein
MIWTTTGNLTNVKDNAKFDFGVAMLPAGKQRGSRRERQLTSSRRLARAARGPRSVRRGSRRRSAARWEHRPGYVAVRVDAWNAGDEAIRGGLRFCGVARDQLPFARRAFTHATARDAGLNDGLQAASRARDAGAGDEDAQREADGLGRTEVTTGRVRRGGCGGAMTRTTQWLYGWLLVLPAAALLALHHYPVVATLWGSFVRRPRVASRGMSQDRQLPAARRRSDLLAGARQQPVV